MNTFTSWGEAFTTSLQNVWFKAISYLPEIIGALVILIIGWWISKGLGGLAARIFRLSKFDQLSEKIGLKKEMDGLGLKFTFADLIGKIVKWFFIVVTLIAVVDVLQIPQVTDFLERIALYIPNVLVAVIILAIGLVVGRFAYGVMERGLGALDMPGGAGKALASLAKWAIFIFAFMAALVQLGIAQNLIQILFSGIVVMLTLAGGLAFGLAGKDKAAKILDSLEEKARRKGGQ